MLGRAQPDRGLLQAFHPSKRRSDPLHHLLVRLRRLACPPELLAVALQAAPFDIHLQPRVVSARVTACTHRAQDERFLRGDIPLPPDEPLR